MSKKLRVVELFSGIGSQTQSLTNIGIDHEVVAIAEIDKFAITSYEALHGKTYNLEDVSKVDVKDIPYCDLLTYSFPCLTGESLVATSVGLKELKDVKVGDLVLTHIGEYKRVLNFFNQGIKEVYGVKGMSTFGLKATLNHKFLVRTKQYEYINKKRVRKFSEPYWKELKEIDRNDYLGIPVNTVEELPTWDGYKVSWFTNKYAKKERVFYSNKISNYLNNTDFWWMLGRYVADGWTRSQGGIVFGIGNSKLETFVKRTEKLYNIHISKEKTCFKVHIVDKELELFVDDFGKGAGNKIIPAFIKNLPIELLDAFLEGYFSGDGSIKGDYIECSSISEKLIYGLSECIYKVYKRPVSLYRNDRSETSTIENRVVNQKPSYCLSFKKNNGSQDQAFFEDGYIWFPFNKKTKLDEQEVFDIEVEDNHSFIANGVIVHNCTDISSAGQRKGLEKGSGTASSLLWECERIIEGKRPKYLLMENVKALLFKDFKASFIEWCKLLESYGYITTYSVLNAKDYGIPQNRERVFAVSIHESVYKQEYLFPKGFPLKLRLKDMLESNVDQKYYINTPQSEKLLKNLKERGYLPSEQNPTINIVGNVTPENSTSFGQRGVVYNDDGIMGTLTSTDYKDAKKILTTESSIIQLGNIVDTGNFKNSQRGRVYSSEGISPTLTAKAGDHPPKMIVGSNRPCAFVGDTNNVAPTLLSGMEMGGGLVPYLLDTPFIASSRGRSAISPTKRDVPKFEQRLEPNLNNTSFTITTVQKDNYVVEKGTHGPSIVRYPHGYNKGGEIYDYVPSITTSAWEQNNLLKEVVNNDFLIRKLTPRECWRLMGFTDGQFDKTQVLNEKGKPLVSNSQLYKQAGNSIVVDCLENLFYALFKDTEFKPTKLPSKRTIMEYYQGNKIEENRKEK